MQSPTARKYCAPHLIAANHDFCRQLAHIDAYKKLRDMGELDALNTQSEGSERPEMSRPFVAPETERQQHIATIWQGLSGIREIGLHDDLFELGADSMMCARFISILSRKFARNLPVSAVADHPTIAALADMLEEGS